MQKDHETIVCPVAVVCRMMLGISLLNCASSLGNIVICVNFAALCGQHFIVVLVTVVVSSLGRQQGIFWWNCNDAEFVLSDCYNFTSIRSNDSSCNILKKVLQAW